MTTKRKASKSPPSKSNMRFEEKDVTKLVGRNSADHLLIGKRPKGKPKENFALKRLAALKQKRDMKMFEGTPSLPSGPNWVPVGPLAVPKGQSYGGATRIMISGRITSIASHPSDPNIIYIGTARGGIWKTINAGTDWEAMSDNADSLAIGGLACSKSNPNTLYAGTGEGNVQYYSTAFPLSSLPGIYLGVGILKSIDGGISWVTQAKALLANYATYRITIDPANDQRAFAATSKGLCRTTDGTNWTVLSGGGLPAISASVIACTDVIIDASDATGNTVFAAFWGSGIYRSTNALSASPSWSAVSGIPSGATISRISLAQSPSMPAKLFALIASSSDTFKGVYQTTDATGTAWGVIISSGVSVYGAYTSNIAVDPTTPNVIYISGVGLYKGVFSAGSWGLTSIGDTIHADSHTFAFHPANNAIIYSGNDGGIFKSVDGGNNWNDSINKGLCLLQYEAIDQNPTSDAVVLGGTQDNGTESFRNSPVFYHSDDGDGGYCNISPLTPDNMISSYYSVSPKRSTQGGKFGTWSSVSAGIDGSGLFYPPIAISPTSNRMACGTDRINIDDLQGTGGWPGTGITLSGISGRVSAVSFADNDTIYAASTAGQVYRLDFIAGTWTARSLHQAPLPSAWIWDIQAVPGSINSVVVVFSSFGIQHVWRGTVPASGAATWVQINGSGTTAVPDVPCYAIAFKDANEFYIGTDIGVFITLDAGATWNNFNQGMPNTAIYDLRFHALTNLLRAATHGRGLWQIKVDAIPTTTSDLYFRDHLMHSGIFNSSSIPTIAAFEDPLNHVTLGSNLWWWMCCDIKVDSPNPSFQLSAPADYFDFETKLEHRDPDKGNTNRLYVQVHNRGPQSAFNVNVVAMFADASAGLPTLPADFWTTFPNSVGDTHWTRVGPAKSIAEVKPLKPIVLEWDWKPPVTANPHTCMLVVMDSPSDPIPAVNKVMDIATLVTNEKRAGLHNLHVIDLLPDEPTVVDVTFYGEVNEVYKAQILKQRVPKHLKLDFIVPRTIHREILSDKGFKGFIHQKQAKKFAPQVYNYFEKREYRTAASTKEALKQFDLSNSFRLQFESKLVELPRLKIPKGGLKALLVITSVKTIVRPYSLSIIQRSGEGKIIGGSTFVIRPAKKHQ